MRLPRRSNRFGHSQRGRGGACEGFQAGLRAIDNGTTRVKHSAGYLRASLRNSIASCRAWVRDANVRRITGGEAALRRYFT
jgi:hypothetical protein